MKGAALSTSTADHQGLDGVSVSSGTTASIFRAKVSEMKVWKPQTVPSVSSTISPPSPQLCTFIHRQPYSLVFVLLNFIKHKTNRTEISWNCTHFTNRQCPATRPRKQLPLPPPPCLPLNEPNSMHGDRNRDCRKVRPWLHT